jgi:glycosyltransferase involved in cell wall biosynthesis
MTNIQNATTVGRYDTEIGDTIVREGNPLRIMPVADSPWASTGFGTNTKNVSAILFEQGHHIGFGGCQNPQHGKWYTPWPLGQTEKEVWFETLPLLFPGQERFGEKSFPHWLREFKPDIVLAHLDFQMFKHMTDAKQPSQITMPFRDENGVMIDRKRRMQMMNNAFKQIQEGPPWKLAVIVPYDGEPSVPQWKMQLDAVDYPLAMSRYGQIGLKKDFDVDAVYMPHGVDTNLFKPITKPKYGKEDKPDAFVVGCVARNQHRKNIPRLIKGFAQFVKKRKLSPDQAKLMLHMDWNDAMGWKFPAFAAQYGIEEYLMPPLMGTLDAAQSLSEEGMANLYNCMDMFVLPTAGEGFGIPTVEAMSCGIPICITNYTTGYELVKSKDPENEDIPMYPLGGGHDDPSPNGRDCLEEEDFCERGILIPYKDMWWDTPNRAAPQRAIASENAICEAIEYYYDNPDKKFAAGNAGRKHAIGHYSWEVVGKRWIDWVKKVEKEIKK